MPSNQGAMTLKFSRTTCPQKSQSLVNSRGGGWDCIRQMQMFRHRPDVLASALRDMGVNESGDEITDECEPHGPP